MSDEMAWFSPQDWAREAFPRLREMLGDDEMQKLRRHAEPPLRQFLPFHGFAALLLLDPKATAADATRLWCVLEKDDFADEPLVRLEDAPRSVIRNKLRIMYRGKHI